MTHGLSRQDWIDYTSGVLPLSRREEFESHLLGCEGCRESARRLSDVDRMLAGLAQQFRDAQPVSEPALHEAFRVWQSRAAQPAIAEPQQLLWLELFLSHLFGPPTAQRAMRRAANQVEAESAETVMAYQWSEFVRNLSDLVRDLCGEPAARLLQVIGCLTP